MRPRLPGTMIGRVSVAALMLGATVFGGSCGKKSGSSPAAGGAGKSATCTGGELFNCRYTYLIRGDDAFPTTTTGFKISTARMEDETARVELAPDPERPVDGGDSCRIFKITLKKEAPVHFVVADSIGSGMVAYEFGKLPPGQYTLGTGGLPREMTRWTKDCKRLVLFLSVESTIRHRARWAVTPQGRLAHQLNF